MSKSKALFALSMLLTALLSAIPVSAPIERVGTPRLDEIWYKVITGDYRIQALLMNEVDVIPGPETEAELNRVISEGYNVIFDPSWGISFFTINCRDFWPPEAEGGPNGKTPGESVQPLSDSQFRVAMTYMWGMDKKNETISSYSSFDFAIESVVPPGQAYWHDLDKHMPDTDWDIAWQILQDAGYYVNFTDRRLYNPDGTQVRDIDVEFSTGSQFWEPIVIDFVASVNGFFQYINATVGPTFNSVALDFKTLIYKLSVYHDFDIACLGIVNLGKNPDWLYNVFHSQNIGWYGWNYGGFDLTEADEILEIILFSKNITEIKEACYEFQHLFNKWYPWIPISSKYLVNTYNPSLMNIIGSPGFSSNNPWTWRLVHWNTSTSGGSVRHALADEPDVLNPLYGNQFSWRIMDRIYDKLLELNPKTHEHIAWEACNWTVEDGSWPELGINYGMKFSFQLRNDMYWHDSGAYEDLNENSQLDPGEPVYCFPVTSEDVKFAWDFINKYEPPMFSDVWRYLVYVETNGPWNVTAYLDTSTLWALNDFTDTAKLLPKHIWEKVDEKIESGDWVSPEDFHPSEISYEEWTGLKPPPQYPFLKAAVGDGPYVFDYFDLGLSTGHVVKYWNYWFDCAVEPNFIAHYRIDPNTEFEFYVEIVDQGSKIEGKLSNSTLDEIRIYIDGVLTYIIPGPITITPFEQKIFGPNTAGPFTFGLHIISCEEYENGTLLEGSTYTHYVYITIEEDLNYDFKIDILDVAMAAKAFGSGPFQPRWDSSADVNDDYKVDIKDIAEIAKKFGWEA